MEQILERLLNEQSRKTERIEDDLYNLYEQYEDYCNFGFAVPEKLNKIIKQTSVELDKSLRLELRWVLLIDNFHKYGYITNSS